ncbi:hypothetical protein QOT17_016413 [Balamuthia mandrillaris]
MPLPACGMRCPPRMKPPRPEPKPVDLVDYQKAPVGGFVVHPDSSKDVTASFEAPFYDLQSLDGVFMTYRAVMRRLDSEEQTLRAIHRYYEFMQLKAKLPKGTMLVPTNDIEAVWLTHMLRPTQYLNELEQLFGISYVLHFSFWFFLSHALIIILTKPTSSEHIGLMDVEHKILLSDFELHHKQLALEDTAQLWQTAYGEAYCNLENDIHEAPPRLWHNFWCGLTVVNEWQSTYSFYNPPEIAIIEAQENSSPISSPFSQIIPSARRPGLKIKKSDASEVPEGWKNPFGFVIPRSAFAYFCFLYCLDWLIVFCFVALRILVFYSFLLFVGNDVNQCCSFSVADVQYIIMNDHPSSLPDISTGLKAYERFLFLCAKYREKIFQEDGTPVPSFSPVPDIISALWQFHMLHPTAYAHDCQRLLGFQLNFGPAALSKNRLGGKASVVEELYLQEFGVDLRMEGMYSRHSELSLYF